MKKEGESSLTSTPQKDTPTKTNISETIHNSSNATPSKKSLSPNPLQQNQDKVTDPDTVVVSGENGGVSASVPTPPLPTKKAFGTKSKPVVNVIKSKPKPVKKDILKIGGMRGKLGITKMEEEPAIKEETKEETKEIDNHSHTEENPGEESSISIGGQNSSIVSNPGNTEAHANPAPAAEQSKEQPFDELLKLFSEVEKSKDPNMCAKMATELESALSKFKNLSVALVSQPVMDTAKTQGDSKSGQDVHETATKRENSSQNVAAPFKQAGKKPIEKGNKNKKVTTTGVKPGTQRGSRVHQPPQKGKLGANNRSSVEAKENRQAEKKKKDTKKENRESITEEIKQKVLEMYGDDAQFDNIQTELVTAYNKYTTFNRMKEEKRSKSATPNKSSNHKEVVLKLHKKLIERQKESEATIMKKTIERQVNKK